METLLWARDPYIYLLVIFKTRILNQNPLRLCDATFCGTAIFANLSARDGGTDFEAGLSRDNALYLVGVVLSLVVMLHRAARLKSD